MFRSRLIPPLALLALALLAPSASAAEWVAPVNFPAPGADLFEGSPGEDQIAYQNGGTATEAFVQSTSLAPLSTELHIGTMAPGGGYSDQLAIPSSANAIPVAVQIAVAPNGAAAAGWMQLTGANAETSPYSFRVAYRPAGSGSWESPVTIATEAKRESAIDPRIRVAISANGSAAVGVQYNADEAGAGENEATARIDVAVRAASSEWSTQRISPAGSSAEDLGLAFDLVGNLTAAYKARYSEGPSAEADDDSYAAVAQLHQATSSLWGAPEDITGSKGSASSLQLGENESGDAVLAYQYAEGGSDPWATTRLTSNGTWSEPAQLVLKGAGSSPEGAGVAANGTAYVLYRFAGGGSGEDCEGVARALVDHAFTPERCVSPVDEEGSPGSIAFLGNDAYAVWRGNLPGPGGSEHASVQSARWTNGSTTPEAARDLDQTDERYGVPVLIPDRQGSLVALYEDETSKTLRAAAYDGGPPILLGASVPGSATAGQPVTFSASLVDLWAGLGAGQPTWSFGDGASATGSTVTHTFAAAGAYAIALNAADALGATTTGTYAIVVAPAPAPPPPATGDRQPPKVTLDTPSCPKKLSKKACRRRRASRAAWRTLHGAVTDPQPSSGIASVEVAVYLTHGKRIVGLSHGRFVKTTTTAARKSFVTAKVSGETWSLKLGKLARGSYTILVRARDRAGNVSPLLSRTVRLS
jgi:hypothetical protein